MHSWPFLLGGIIGVFFFLLQVTGFNFEFFPGDLGDGRFNLFALENSHQFISGQQESLWEGDFMYPEEKPITLSDNLVGSAPFYSIFRWIGLDMHTSYQWWFIIVGLLNYICAYVFLKYVFKDHKAAALGALIFAFSMALQSQMTHSQTFPRFPIPLIFLMLYRFAERLDWRYFLYGGLFLSYQIYCGIYLGMMAAIPFGLMTLILVFQQRKLVPNLIKRSSWLLKMIGSSVVILLSIVPLLLPYLNRSKSTGLNEFDYVFPTIPTLHSHFFSQRGSIFWDFMDQGAERYQAFWDHQLFAGGIATISFLIFVVLMFKRVWDKSYDKRTSTDWKYLIGFLLVALTTFLLFLRIGNFSLYAIIFEIPGFGAMRSLTRIINVEMIYFALAGTWIFMELKNRVKIHSTILFLGIAAIFTLDNYFSADSIYRNKVSESTDRIDELKSKLLNLPEGSVFSYEPENVESMPLHQQIDAMLVAKELHLKTVNGYSATSPKGYDPFWWNMDSTSRNSWLATHNLTAEKIVIIK